MTEAPAIPAATLVLVRERSGGQPELLMVERAEGMAFAGGALVFPGGRIDEADGALGAALGDPYGGARVAAIRETIEETAIAVGLSPLPSSGETLELQRALIADQPLAHLLERAGLSLDLDALIPLARWVPKFHATRRFDTMFFVGRAPDGDWQPQPAQGECTGAFWVTAEDVLERDRAGKARLIFPTRRNLERLARHDSFDAIVADARAHALTPITPWVEEIGGERYVTIAGDIGYPVVREKLDQLWRG